MCQIPRMGQHSAGGISKELNRIGPNLSRHSVYSWCKSTIVMWLIVIDIYALLSHPTVGNPHILTLAIIIPVFAAGMTIPNMDTPTFDKDVLSLQVGPWWRV